MEIRPQRILKGIQIVPRRAFKAVFRRLVTELQAPDNLAGGGRVERFCSTLFEIQ
jgi:hypothetical protein